MDGWMEVAWFVSRITQEFMSEFSLGLRSRNNRLDFAVQNTSIQTDTMKNLDN